MAAAWTKGIKFVKKHNTRTACTGALEDLAYRTFTLTHELIKELWSLHRNKIGSARVGECFGQQSFAAARWAVKKNPCRAETMESIFEIGVSLVWRRVGLKGGGEERKREKERERDYHAPHMCEQGKK